MHDRPEIWATAVLLAVVAAAAVIDVWKGLVPNALTYPAVLIGLVGQGLQFGSDGLLRSAGGLAVGLGVMLVFWLAGGVKGGDAKLVGAVGALTGARFAATTMICFLAVGALMAVAVMIRRRIVRRTLKRIARALYLAAVPGSKGARLSEEESPRLPYAVAIAVGAGIALADAWLNGPIARSILGI